MGLFEDVGGGVFGFAEEEEGSAPGVADGLDKEEGRLGILLSWSGCLSEDSMLRPLMFSRAVWEICQWSLTGVERCFSSNFKLIKVVEYLLVR